MAAVADEQHTAGCSHSSGVEGHDGRVAEGGGEPVDLGSEAHELGGGAFGDERFGVADPEQQLPV
jgi:hypothetical protein